MIAISPAGINARQSVAGFTLIELLVALTIMSMLVASISFVLIERKPTLKNQVQQVARQLRLAQQRAIRDDRPFQVEFDLAANRFWLAEETIDLPAEVEVTVRTSEDQLIDSNSVGLTFYPDASASGGRIRIEDANESFEIRITWITGKVEVEQLGRAGLI